MNSESVSRTYSSPLREKQATETRAAIVAALAEQVLDRGMADFSIPNVAERAGVSVRTIYRYFPTREDLLNAVRDSWRSPDALIDPQHATELPDHARRLYPYLARNATIAEAALATPLGREARGKDRKRRDDQVRQLLAPYLDALPEQEALAHFALLRLIMSGEGWTATRRIAGPDSAEACGEVAAWALEHLLKKLAKKNERARKARARTSPDADARGAPSPTRSKKERA